MSQAGNQYPLNNNGLVSDDNARDLGETEDGNKIYYQCPRCEQTESFNTQFEGFYDMDGSGCWDDWTKDRQMEMQDGADITCKGCGYADCKAVFDGSAELIVNVKILLSQSTKKHPALQRMPQWESTNAQNAAMKKK